YGEKWFGKPFHKDAESIDKETAWSRPSSTEAATTFSPLRDHLDSRADQPGPWPISANVFLLPGPWLIDINARLRSASAGKLRNSFSICICAALVAHRVAAMLPA